jgi:hypothetical protein
LERVVLEVVLLVLEELAGIIRYLMLLLLLAVAVVVVVQEQKQE